MRSSNGHQAVAGETLARVALALAIGIVLWRLRDFFPVHTLPARGDPSLPFPGNDLTSQWAPWLRAAVDALWHQGVLAFWNPFTNAGAPQFEAPEAGVLGLPVILGGVLPFEAAVKWAMLAHVAAGMWGVSSLTRRMGVAPVFAAAGAFFFGTGTYLLDHFRAGHLSHIEPMCLAPWAMLLLWKALSKEEAWHRPAAGAGIVAGLQVLEGGSSVVVYSVLAFGLLAVTSAGPSFVASVGRFIRVGAVAAGCFLLTAAPQLLPMIGYVALTDRSGGLSLALSSVAISEVTHPLPSVLAAAAMGFGFVWFVIKGERRAALWLAAIVVVGVAAASSSFAYGLLWRFVPGFSYQRIPQRALVLVGLAGPVLLAASIEGAWHLARQWRAAAALAAAALFVVLGYDAWSRAPGTPPMADPRVEREQNHAMQWLAEHAAGSRVHIWESPTRHWGADHIMVPLGLEAITSYTPSEHRDYLPGDIDAPARRSFLGESYANPARFWGLLNVRYAVSSVPRGDAGWTLAARVEPCPVDLCQPAKSAGTYIYENERWLPRAWMVEHAIALVGDPTAVFGAALDVLAMPGFDPARTVVLQVEPGAPIPPADALFAIGASVPNAIAWGSEDARTALAPFLGGTPAVATPALVSRPTNNHLSIEAPSAGWLVASEKLALYDGWSASIIGAHAPIIRADGVLAAFRINAGDVVSAVYEPPNFRLGLMLFAAMPLLVGAAEINYRRRRTASNF